MYPFNSKNITGCIPIQMVSGGMIISTDGSITIGWELFPKEEGSMTEEDQKQTLALWESAVRCLPVWTIIHRQDVFKPRIYKNQSCKLSNGKTDFLSNAYMSHFNGREYLELNSYVFFTFNPVVKGPSGVMKSTFSRTSDGKTYRIPSMDGLEKRIEEFERNCKDFIGTIEKSCSAPSVRLGDKDFLGEKAGHGGLFDEYLDWFIDSPLKSDILLDKSPFLDKADHRMAVYSISTCDDLPSEVSSSLRQGSSLYESDSKIRLSSSYPIGSGLSHPHILNFYLITTDQAEIHRSVKASRRNKISMSSRCTSNQVNADLCEEFLRSLVSDTAIAVYTHISLLVFDRIEKMDSARSEVCAALSSMGIRAKVNVLDPHHSFICSIPGSEAFLGKDSMMLSELCQSLCLLPMEGFQRDFPTGEFHLCDRHRHVPVRIDLLRQALKANLIECANAFILGPTGVGKSFFCQWYLSRCYSLGSDIMVIDKGESYEGLSRLIAEVSDGKDGHVIKLSVGSPIGFSPFAGFRSLYYEQRSSYLNYLSTLIRLIYSPHQGWTQEKVSILEAILVNYIENIRIGENDPDFSHFISYLESTLKPLICQMDKRQDGSFHDFNVDGIVITKEKFDIESMILALRPFKTGNNLGKILNGNGSDNTILASRFTVLETDGLTADQAAYKVIIFCLMHLFEAKMHSSKAPFKTMLIEEAWQAIASKDTAEYMQGLWKTSRKYSTSMAVVTQQISDLTCSDIVKDAIISNSPIKVLLDMSGNAASLQSTKDLLGMSESDMSKIRSIGRGIPAGSPSKEVFISLGSRHSAIYSMEVSDEEALLFESNKEAKETLFTREQERKSMIEALREIISSNKQT